MWLRRLPERLEGDTEPKQRGPLALADHSAVLGQFHQFARSWLVCGFDEHGANWVNTECPFVPLLTLDEMVIRAELFEHVGLGHCASIRFVAKVGKSKGF
jgi:hypothetical protein